MRSYSNLNSYSMFKTLIEILSNLQFSLFYLVSLGICHAGSWSENILWRGITNSSSYCVLEKRLSMSLLICIEETISINLSLAEIRLPPQVTSPATMSCTVQGYWLTWSLNYLKKHELLQTFDTLAIRYYSNTYYYRSNLPMFQLHYEYNLPLPPCPNRLQSLCPYLCLSAMHGSSVLPHTFYIL